MKIYIDFGIFDTILLKDCASWLLVADLEFLSEIHFKHILETYEKTIETMFEALSRRRRP